MMRPHGSATVEREGDDAGFTLVELIVAVVILGLVLTMVGGFFITTTRIVAMTRTTSESTGTASNVLDEVSRVIRSGTDNPVLAQPLAAPAFLTATTESLTIYSYVDSYVSGSSTELRPQIVQVSLTTDRRVREKRWVPSSSASGYFVFPALTTTPASSRIIGGPLAATPSGGVPLFTYLNQAGAPVVQPATGYTPDQLRTVAAVKLTVRVSGTDAQSDNTVLLQNTVRIPNLGFTGATP